MGSCVGAFRYFLFTLGIPELFLKNRNRMDDFKILIYIVLFQ